jgi:DNA-binding NarL/FixJ family response regulator
MNEPLRLLIVDGHPLFRECLAVVLQADGGFEVEIATDWKDLAEGILALLAVRLPDVLLVGFDLPGAAELIRRTAALFPAVRAVLLGSVAAEDEIVACLEAGARGYVLREQSLAELLAAISRVAAGEIVVTAEIAHRLFGRLGELGRLSRRRRRLEFLDLTAREIEILDLIAQGLRNQEIADRLYLSVHTVKNHVHNMLERLGLKTRAEAVRYARERGWLPTSGRPLNLL